MNVPFLDLKKQYDSIKPEIDSAIQEIITSSAFIGGAAHKKFEEAFAAHQGVKYCVGVGNGTDALYVALKSMGLGAGDEVIVPANSFIASSEAVSLTGAHVVFADVSRATALIDVADVERKITSKTKAIVAVHLYGQPAPMKQLVGLAQKRRLKILEDAAQAHGAAIDGVRVGNFGEAATFSFFPGKNLGAYGDGGAIVSNSQELAEKCRMYANHGRLDKYDHKMEGINSRLDGLQAAILNVKLKHLEKWTEQRIAIADHYDKHLPKDVERFERVPGNRHVYHLYVIKVKAREALLAHLKEKGIGTGIHYPIALPLLKAYAHLGHTEKDFPVSAVLSGEIMSIPVDGAMTIEQARYVTDVICGFYTK